MLVQKVKDAGHSLATGSGGTRVLRAGPSVLTHALKKNSYSFILSLLLRFLDFFFFFRQNLYKYHPCQEPGKQGRDWSATRKQCENLRGKNEGLDILGFPQAF